MDGAWGGGTKKQWKRKSFGCIRDISGVALGEAGRGVGFVESCDMTPVFRLLNYKPGLLWRYERQGGSEAVQYGRCIQVFFGGHVAQLH